MKGGRQTQRKSATSHERLTAPGFARNTTKQPLRNHIRVPRHQKRQKDTFHLEQQPRNKSVECSRLAGKREQRWLPPLSALHLAMCSMRGRALWAGSLTLDRA